MNNQQPHISIVSPVYMAEKILKSLVERISKSLESITTNYEIVFVDDRSPDNSWEKIIDLSKSYPQIKGIRLSRNFGQHYAITAGLDSANGEWVVVMDCDLQDKPEEIPNLYKKALEGYDAVLARRHDRKDKMVKKLFSMFFYRTLGYLTGSKQDETIANFGIYNRKLINEIKGLRESIRYFPTMVRWVGFKVTAIQVQHSERLQGNTSYNFKKLIALALDIILAYSDKPIRLVIKFGMFISLFSVLFILITIYKFSIGEIEVLGYSSLIISIWFLSGCLLVTMGVVGLYVGKTFEGVKNRPIYIIDEYISSDTNK